MKKYLQKIRRSEAGQSATEYMLIIAVVVLALVSVASKFITFFESGVNDMGARIQTEYLSNDPGYTSPTDN